MDKISQKRIVEFDIARGIAIFLMILQHVWLLIFSRFFDSVWLDYLFFNLGTVLAAPVFLFLMGVNIFLSHQNTSRSLIIRGVKLFLLGYLLSFFRFFLPLVLTDYFNLIVEPEKIIYHFPVIYYLLEIDILQLAGLSLISLAIFKKIKTPLKYYPAIIFLIFLLSPILKSFNDVLGSWHYFIDPFWGNSDYVIFPLFPWLAYSLAGYYFGNFFINSINKKNFYNYSLKIVWPIFLLGLIFFILNPSFSYYHHLVGSGLIFISIVVLWVSLLGLWWQKIPYQAIRVLSNWSKNVTSIYFFQWLIIAWMAIILNIFY